MKIFTVVVLGFVLILPQFSCKKEKEVSRLIVQTVIGNVTIKDTRAERKAQIGDEIKQGDIITTAKTSLVDIQYGQKGAIRIDENSSVNIARLVSTEAGEDGNLDMDKGKMFLVISKLKRKDSFSVKTNTAVASVRGTSFRVISGDKRVRIDTLSGKIKVNPVKDGKVIKTVEKVIEKNVSVVMDEKVVDEIIEGKKEIAAVELKPEEIKEIKEEVKDIKLGKKMGEAVKKEIKEVVFEEKTDVDAQKEEDDSLKEEEKLKAEKAQLKLQQDRKASHNALKARQEKARLEKARLEKSRIDKEQQEKARKEQERIQKAKKEQEKKENRVKNIPNL